MHWFFKVGIILLILVGLFLGFSYLLPYGLPTKQVFNNSVSGIIFQNQEWSGTVRVDGDLVTALGAIITIKPGTNVLIAKTGDRFNLDFFPWHAKHGINIDKTDHGIEKGEPFWDEKQKVFLRFAKLLAEGTSDSPIIMTSESSQGSPYDINLIYVAKGKLDNVYLSNYRRLEVGPEVVVQNSQFNKTGECAICIRGGHPTILGNVFTNSKRAFLVISYASPMIKMNKFLESSSLGLIFSGNAFSNVKVTDNLFNMNGQTALWVVSPDEGGFIAHNDFSSGDIRMSCNSKVLLTQNKILSNIVFENDGNCKGFYTLGANYWPVKAEDVIRSKIIGTTPNFQVRKPIVLKAADVEK